MNSPFLNVTFTSIWSKHFNKGKKQKVFKFISGVTFYKVFYFPLFINTGKNLTKGVFYKLNTNEFDFKKKVFLVYDVPDYFKVNISTTITSGLKLKPIEQYKGYLLATDKLTSSSDYIKGYFSSKRRWKINRALKRLDTCLDTKFYIHYGKNTSKDKFNAIFNQFNLLLEKRTLSQGKLNHNLKARKWSFLKELSYQMILEQKAILFVMYNKDIPISITLNFLSKDIMFSILPVFDIDYEKFNLGYVSYLKQIDWCINNKIKIFDFSKGHYDYKKQLSSMEYDFKYHVFYDSKSFRALLLGKLIILFFKLKQFLRAHNFNYALNKLIFITKNYNKKRDKERIIKTNQTELDSSLGLREINFSDQNYPFLKKYVFDFLFKNKLNQNKIKVFEILSKKKSFIIMGNNTHEKIEFKKI